MEYRYSRGKYRKSGLPLLASEYPAANVLEQYSYLHIGAMYVVKVNASIKQENPDVTNLGTDFVLIWGILLNEFGENVLFGRKYRVIVSDVNGVGIDVSTLRCTFQIEKSLLETPNYAEIVLYNLSAQTENSIIKEGAKVILEAGYQNPQYGLIFREILYSL